MFVKAQPIWLLNRENEKNIQAKFVADFRGAENTVLKITGATFYKVYLNGDLLHYGPAPAAYGHSRVDIIDIKPKLNENNQLIIEAAGYNCFAYACVKEQSFIRAEICADGVVIAATGTDFRGYYVPSRLQKTLRYSFQRHFTEVWDLSLNDVEEKVKILDLNLKYLKRKSPLPDMSEEKIRVCYEKNEFNHRKNDWKIPSLQGATDKKCDEIDLFAPDEIAEKPILELSTFDYSISKNETALPCKLDKNEYAVFECKANTCGLINLKFNSSDDCKIIIVFDEKLIDGIFDYKKWDSLNVIKVATAGKHSFSNFEVYGFKYFAVFVVSGNIELEEASITQIINPIKDFPELNCDDKEIADIYEAALQSARCNSLGVFMDCPTRERAGWLCDSYFTAQAMYKITGNTDVEDDFMENFLQSDGRYLPAGMLPMCYPADHPNGNYIPQWAMWYIIEAEQYVQRNTNVSAVLFKETAYNLLGYFKKYENEFGLLEDLGGWNFVEWSKANEWTDGVNFPTNMLYQKILKIIGEWFDDEMLLKKSEALKEIIIKMSFNGKFFCDQALRSKNGNLVLQNNISEVCQYYAFMFDVADKEDFYSLYNTLVTGFSPELNNFKEIEKINAFMGFYMRMELLLKWGHENQLIEEIKSFFGHMAEITGTLWEHKHMSNSLNHGFTAYLMVILLSIYNK